MSDAELNAAIARLNRSLEALALTRGALAGELDRAVHTAAWHVEQLATPSNRLQRLRGR